MPQIPKNIYHDIRPIGPSGSVLVSHPSGAISSTDWIRLSPNRLYSDLSITAFTASVLQYTAGTGIANPLFFITYSGSPSGATITSAGTGVKTLVDPYTTYQWVDTFPTGSPNQTRTFTITASGEFGTTTASLDLIWLQKQYWGVGTTGTYNSAFINAITNSRFASGHYGEFAFAPTGNEYIFYAYRSAAGPATFIDKATNIKGGFVLDGSGISYSNAAGYTEAYSVYRSEYPGLGSLNIIVGSG